MPRRYILHSAFLCTRKIRCTTAVEYLHVEVELIIGLLNGGVQAQAGWKLWQLHSITLVARHSHSTSECLSQALNSSDAAHICNMQSG